MNGYRGLAVLVAALATTGMAAAQAPERPRLHTNEAYVEEATRTTDLAIADPMAVFAYVLANLPERVTVYPTENYYYFTFIHNGTRYAGNLRLDAGDRDAGKVHFAYTEDMSNWRDDAPIFHVVLDAGKGVSVEKVERLVYRISHAGKSVVFALNDLSQVRPPAGALGPDERFLGPIFDESAIRFFLVYNFRLKIFHYILDETVKVADDLVPRPRIDRILVGKRTGFAFYRDRKLDRKILIGVFEGNVKVNNYFDGPFDQLPDNFIEGDALRNVILEVKPSLKGKIGRLGGYEDGSDRFLIAPYREYRALADLDVVHACATSRKVPAADYYKCFVIDDDSQGDPRARPLALKSPTRRPPRQ